MGTMLSQAPAQAPREVWAVALYPVIEEGAVMPGSGRQVSDTLYAALMQWPDTLLLDVPDMEVERAAPSPARIEEYGRGLGANAVILPTVVARDRRVLVRLQWVPVEGEPKRVAHAQGSSASRPADIARVAVEELEELVYERPQRGLTPNDPPGFVDDWLARWGDAPRPALVVEVQSRAEDEATFADVVQTGLSSLSQRIGFEDGAEAEMPLRMSVINSHHMLEEDDDQAVVQVELSGTLAAYSPVEPDRTASTRVTAIAAQPSTALNFAYQRAILRLAGRLLPDAPVREDEQEENAD